ncbi:MAG: SPFH/Band 7/PHB domain protein [Erysipelotrichaceae bacterium]|nr:SPFH/Band 7/PHB domain protein [Erysipelotrichaceae bacterium]
MIVLSSLTGLLVVIGIVFVLVLIALFSSIVIVHQTEAYIVERIGKYHSTLDVGFHMIIPFIDKVVKKVSLKEQVVDFKPQPVITKDNVTIQIDTVVFFQITDARMFTYGVSNPMAAIENLTATTLRNIIGDLELDATLTSRDVINSKMRMILDEATDSWGIKVRRVELKNIIPPRDIQEAMEKQMRAERERREKILQAEGEKKSAILIAEGEKESIVLRAEAKKQALIAEAEGVSKSIQLINDSNPSKAYLTIKGYEALEKVADGKSTKLIIPSELSSLTSVVAAGVETVESMKNKELKK